MNRTNTTITNTPPQPITLPKTILLWILSNVAEPIAGFEHKRTQTGQYISAREQLNETYYQVMLIAMYFYKKGAPEEKILTIISPFKRNRFSNR